ncbi:MAG: PLDc N-terminal domain-containing protein [Mailhella sp.]|nr:PLDc N-terminal domain-containing protein [Mailhella sp.]
MDDFTFYLLGGVAALIGFSWAVGCAIHALLHKKDPQAALAWVACIFFLPFLGTLAYTFFGVSRANSLAARLLDEAAKWQVKADSEVDRELTDSSEGYSDAEACDVAEPHISGTDLCRAACVGRSITGRPLLGGNRLELLKNGEEAYPAMLAAIDAATRMVCLSTYIFKGDDTGRAFSEALGRAAERGVDVRLIIDGMGGVLYSLKKPWKALRARGVKVEMFLPPRLWPPMLCLNLRTHRKVLTCDGEVAFTGGMNIGDHHLISLPTKGRVQDVHFRCTGPVAARLEEAFLMDWAFVSHKATVPAMPKLAREGDTLCRLVFDGLGHSREDIHELICGVISTASQRVTIFTPYFIPPRELIGALVAAVQRGVQVDIVLPEKNNLFYVHHASRHIQAGLVEKGIRIWYQPAPFAHTKLLMVDGCYALFGSANLDPRSLFLNFELNVEAVDTEFRAQLDEYADDILSRSRRLTSGDYARRSLPVRLFDAACWLMGPYI